MYLVYLLASVEKAPTDFIDQGLQQSNNNKIFVIGYIIEIKY